MKHLFEVEDLRRGLATRVVGRHIALHEELPSTNQRALELAAEPGNHGAVVLAERQTAGRGRLSRRWHSPKGASVLFSTVLLLDDSTPAARTVLLWSAVAACEAIEEASAVHAAIKWPNDIVVAGRKLCGILIESRAAPQSRAFVIGIGINCLQHARHFPPEIRDRVTSLDLESSVAVDRVAVVRALICRLDAWLERAGRVCATEIKRAWLDRAAVLGTRLHLESGGRRFSGRVVDLDPQAGILMELEHGGRRLFDPHSTSVVTDVTPMP